MKKLQYFASWIGTHQAFNLIEDECEKEVKKGLWALTKGCTGWTVVPSAYIKDSPATTAYITTDNQWEFSAQGDGYFGVTLILPSGEYAAVNLYGPITITSPTGLGSHSISGWLIADKDVIRRPDLAKTLLSRYPLVSAEYLSAYGIWETTAGPSAYTTVSAYKNPASETEENRLLNYPVYLTDGNSLQLGNGTGNEFNLDAKIYISSATPATLTSLYEFEHDSLETKKTLPWFPEAQLLFTIDAGTSAVAWVGNNKLTIQAVTATPSGSLDNWTKDTVPTCASVGHRFVVDLLQNTSSTFVLSATEYTTLDSYFLDHVKTTGTVIYYKYDDIQESPSLTSFYHSGTYFPIVPQSGIYSVGMTILSGNSDLVVTDAEVPLYLARKFSTLVTGTPYSGLYFPCSGITYCLSGDFNTYPVTARLFKVFSNIETLSTGMYYTAENNPGLPIIYRTFINYNMPTSSYDCTWNRHLVGYSGRTLPSGPTFLFTGTIHPPSFNQHNPSTMISKDDRLWEMMVNETYSYSREITGFDPDINSVTQTGDLAASYFLSSRGALTAIPSAGWMHTSLAVVDPYIYCFPSKKRQPSVSGLFKPITGTYTALLDNIWPYPYQSGTYNKLYDETFPALTAFQLTGTSASPSWVKTCWEYYGSDKVLTPNGYLPSTEPYNVQRIYDAYGAERVVLYSSVYDLPNLTYLRAPISGLSGTTHTWSSVEIPEIVNCPDFWATTVKGNDIYFIQYLPYYTSGLTSSTTCGSVTLWPSATNLRYHASAWSGIFTSANAIKHLWRLSGCDQETPILQDLGAIPYEVNYGATNEMVNGQLPYNIGGSLASYKHLILLYGATMHRQGIGSESLFNQNSPSYYSLYCYDTITSSWTKKPIMSGSSSWNYGVGIDDMSGYPGYNQSWTDYRQLLSSQPPLPYTPIMHVFNNVLYIGINNKYGDSVKFSEPLLYYVSSG